MTLVYQLALTRVKGVGNALAKQLIDHCGSAEEVFRSPKKHLTLIPGIGEYLANNIACYDAMEAIEKEVAFIDKHQIEVLFWNEANYPAKLRACVDAPVLLYFKGNANLQAKKIISIVGTRNASTYGKQLCDELVEAFQAEDILIVSGLAHGIDSFAHQACVQRQVPTVGVLGHGLDRIYPSVNRKLAAAMLNNGGLLTEYPSGTSPERQNFPSRNRIIAGLADVTVVVEANIKGGALITAEIANGYNRDVCAFPGDINKATSRGCNHLIKTHRAHLISSAKDLAYLMNWEFTAPKKEEQQLALELALNPVEQLVYGIVKEEGPLGIDALSYKANLPQSKLAIALLELEMKGFLVALPGKTYRIP
ncbi:DNA-processing protein DprA [Olivibacter sp. XZL3]|uniref:DNA-processing protein DprA n=1 Tax=Olivibacter sp. XZL3 TaxID=1735116 RepID=UPI001066981D|nr:DNA-processing protein DprA [Olivibacter sp. XZL3]